MTVEWIAALDFIHRVLPIESTALARLLDLYGPMQTKIKDEMFGNIRELMF